MKNNKITVLKQYRHITKPIVLPKRVNPVAIKYLKTFGSYDPEKTT